MLQLVANGPVIPDDVLQALEEDRLVFFCGAGISVYTGLPDFRRLTRDVFQACRVPLANSKKRSREPWDYAYHAKQYDKALDLLERKALPGVMREKAIERLTQPPRPKLKRGAFVHKALLDLARCQHGYRLVTTNFDDRFRLADPKLRSDDAPRLAPPRRDRWRQLTFLHGRIDRSRDPGGETLVLTSADFGNAYLRDAWAARFVIELFREFSVVFVGYSLNDPALSYLVDALAADRGEQFNQAFAFDGYDGSEQDRERKSQAWQAKNVELIPVLAANADFRLLNETLVEWSRHSNSPSQAGASWRRARGRAAKYRSQLPRQLTFGLGRRTRRVSNLGGRIRLLSASFCGASPL
jgi:hypothetical protein